MLSIAPLGGEMIRHLCFAILPDCDDRKIKQATPHFIQRRACLRAKLRQPRHAVVPLVAILRERHGYVDRD